MGFHLAVPVTLELSHKWAVVLRVHVDRQRGSVQTVVRHRALRVDTMKRRDVGFLSSCCVRNEGRRLPVLGRGAC